MMTDHQICYTHTQPDADAIVSAWLGDRFLMPMKFFNWSWDFLSFRDVGEPAMQEKMERAALIVDIGNRYQRAPSAFGMNDGWRFDHHQMDNPRATCAAELVFEALSFYGLGPRLRYLERLIACVKAGDRGTLYEDGYGLSADLGLHALFAGIRLRAIQKAMTSRGFRSEPALVYEIDTEHLQQSFILLDCLAGELHRRQQLTDNLMNVTPWRSPDGALWAVQNAPLGSVGQAFKHGANVVVNLSWYELPKTHTFEIWLAKDVPFSLADLLQALPVEVQTQLSREAIGPFHQESRFLVRGSAKAPNPEPVYLDVVTVAQALHTAWEKMTDANRTGA